VIVEIGLVFLGVIFLMVIRLPVAMSFAAGAIVLLAISGTNPVWATTQSLHLKCAYVLLAMPLYILLGAVVDVSGMANRLCAFATSVVGWLRGGLGAAIIMANAVFGAMSGSALAALAGIGKAFLPAMEQAGYPKSYAIALMIPSSVLSCLIPPSAFMIIFGFMGFLSITKCFLASAIPGLILMSFLFVTHLVICPRIPTAFIQPKVSFGAYLKGIAKSGFHNALTLAIPVVVLGIIYGGFGTPTESAALGVLYTLIISFFIYRTITIGVAFNATVNAARLVGSVAMILFFFFVLSRVLIVEQVSEALLTWMMSVTSNKWALMGMLNILMLFMGMFMDDTSNCVIAAIIFLPIAVSLGFNPFHFATIACVNIEFGMITPPVAPLLYLGGHIAGDMPIGQYFKPVLLFLVFAFLPTLLLTMFIPDLSTFLPLLFTRG